MALPVGPFVKISHQRRSVVLLDKIDDRFRQVVLSGKLGAVLNMGDYHQCAHCRDQRFQTVFLVGGLVFDKVTRLKHLADVVIVRPHADQQPPGADGVGGCFGD